MVDSGGQGLMVVLQGAYEAFCGNPVIFDAEAPAEQAPGTSKAPEAKVAEERAKLEKYTQMIEQVRERLAQLG